MPVVPPSSLSVTISRLAIVCPSVPRHPREEMELWKIYEGSVTKGDETAVAAADAAVAGAQAAVTVVRLTSDDR
ncbi:hypothetical protein Tco_0497797, partial [Tanacetum coccineum]